MPKNKEVDIKYLCSRIKQYRFNLRISINLTDSFDSYMPHEIIDYCKHELNADQIIFRVLYKSDYNTVQDKWIKTHGARNDLISDKKNTSKLMVEH